MKGLIIAAVGLALMVGIVVGAITSNLFGATAQRTSAAAVTGSGCYTNWNSADCAPGWTAVSTGEWTAVYAGQSGAYQDMAGTVVCASPKTELTEGASFISQVTAGGRHPVSHEPCAICCATGTYAVGGVAELPALAGPGGGSGMGGATYAVLAGAAAGVLAFAVLATLAVKRRGVG